MKVVASLGAQTLPSLHQVSCLLSPIIQVQGMGWCVTDQCDYVYIHMCVCVCVCVCVCSADGGGPNCEDFRIKAGYC